MSEKFPRIGLGVMVSHNDKLLLGKRLGGHGHNTWQLPGGHLEWFETLEACAQRELFEETGLSAQYYSKGPFVDALFHSADKHYISLIMIAHNISGELSLKEPDKCACWQWFPYDTLPSPLFLPLANMLEIYDLKALMQCPAERAMKKTKGQDLKITLPTD